MDFLGGKYDRSDAVMVFEVPIKLHMFQLILVGEPLLVIGASAPSVSDAVYGLVSLISPLEFGGDFRPYFTIHDTDFRRYTSANVCVFPDIGFIVELVIQTKLCVHYRFQRESFLALPILSLTKLWIIGLTLR